MDDQRSPCAAWVRVVLAAGMLCAVLAMSACGRAGSLGGAGGLSSTPTSTPATASSLRCTVSQHISGIDVIVATLGCQVSGAASTDTSFTLSYTVNGPGTQTRAEDTPCSGSLHNGAGSCSQSYSLIAPNGFGSGVVAGETQPDHRQLGPVIVQPAP